MPTRDNLKAILVVVIWGVNFVVLDEGLRGFPPFLLVTIRFTFVAFPLVLFLPRPAPWRSILMVGVTTNAGQYLLLYLSMHLGMPPGLASLVLQAQVMFTIVIAGLALHERASARQVGGVLLGLCGIAVVAAGYGASAPILPLLLTLAAALAWATGNALTRRMRVSNGLALVAWAAMVVPAPALGLSLLVDGPHAVGHALAHIDARVIASSLYTVVCSTLVGFGLWNSLLSRHPGHSVVPFALLVPVVGIVAAWIWLGQAPTLTETVGGLVLMAGVATATLRRAAARPVASGGGPYPECAPPEPPPLDSPLSPSPASPA